jgi:hypothetical protein
MAANSLPKFDNLPRDSRYTKAADQKRLGESAMAKLFQDENRKESPPLSEDVPQSGTILAPKSLKT